jgi:gliding motility-associated-like protein
MIIFVKLKRGLLLYLLVFLLKPAMAQQPLYFSPNLGQWQDPSVAHCLFKGGGLFLRKDGFRVKVLKEEDLHLIHKAFHLRGIDTQFVVHGHATDVKFLGCNPDSEIRVQFEDEASWYENYFLGDNPDHWVKEVYPARKIRLLNVYHKIDFIIYTRGEEVEFDWLIQPGGNPADIKMEFTGQDALKVQEDKITAVNPVGSFSFAEPKAFQNGKPVSCVYTLTGHGNTVSFIDWGMSWDRSKPLLIDPLLVFSTYSGSRGDNFGFTATYDTGGHFYSGGIVDNEQGSYPVTVGAFQTTYGGRGPAQAPVYLPCDVAISKYTPNGNALVWASYLGGRSNEYPHSLGIDEKNNLLILGTTLSPDFPVRKQNTFDTGYNGNHDLYVVKISANGSNLMHGTYLGGPQNDGINTGSLHYNYADDFRGDIICDPLGNIYLATCTRSPSFPVTAGAAQTTNGGGLESAIVSLKGDLSALRWSSFMGGNLDDAAYSIKLDDSANVIVAGGTSSLNFKTGTKALFPNYLGGQADGYVLKLSPDSGKYITSTYWGTAEYDQIYFTDLDNKNKIFITGQTEGNVQRTSGTYGSNNKSQFIARLSNNLDSLELATTFGNRDGWPELSPCAFLVDKCYNIYFSGWGSSVGVGNEGTTQGLEVSGNAYQKTTDNNDFYLIVLGKDAKNLLYATYFGGDESEDHVDGGTSRFDKRGIIYQSVCSSCPSAPPGLNDFPTTSGSAFPTNVSYRCSNASFKFDFNITFAVEANFFANPLKICAPDTISFFQTATYGRKFVWNFGDGNTFTGVNPKHYYTEAGNYKVTLVVIDSGSCNVTDTHSLTVQVLAGPLVKVKIDANRCDPEVKLSLEGKDFGNVRWDLGDGDTATGNSLKHIYAPGKYTLKLTYDNPKTGCKDSLVEPIIINKDTAEEVFLANVFTPNADAKNDCFQVVGLSKACDKASIKIYNRWGELMYKSDDLAECWNGRVNNTGPDVPEGNYFYQIVIEEIGGKVKNRTVHGSITIIR